MATSDRPSGKRVSRFSSYLGVAMILQVFFTAYSGAVYLCAGTAVIGAGDAAALGVIGLCAAVVYAVSAIQTFRHQWPAVTSIVSAIISAAWMIVVAVKYGLSDRVLAGIGAALAVIVTTLTIAMRDTRASLWRVREVVHVDGA